MNISSTSLSANAARLERMGGEAGRLRFAIPETAPTIRTICAA